MDARKGYGGKGKGGGKPRPKATLGAKEAAQPGHELGQCPPTPETPVRQRYYLGAIGVKDGY